MATTIKLKNGSGAPLAGDLVQGEPAIDLTNKRLYTEDSGGTVIEVGTNPTSLTTGTFTSTGIDDNATSTAITIDSSENVGIGTNSPGTTLDVVGTHRVYGSGATAVVSLSSNSTLGTISSGASATTQLSFETGGSEAVRIDSSGNVGIGTSDPSSFSIDTGPDIILGDGTDNPHLSIVSPTTGTGYVAFADGTAGTAKYSGLIEYAHTTDHMGLRTGGTERMRIDSSGNVGIGLTAPDNTLHVQGASTTGGPSTGNVALFEGPSGTNGVKVFVDDTANACGFQTISSDDLLLNPLGGNVGIGTTSPAYPLQVNGKSYALQSVNANGSASAPSYAFGNDEDCGMYRATTNAIGFSTDGTERMRISDSGKVSVFAESTVSPNMEINRTALSSGDGVLLNLECNNNSGTGNILRFTNDDPTIVSGDYVGEIQFFSDDAGAPNSGLVAGFQVVSENSSGDSAFTWRTGGTERMRINSSGNLLVGFTSNITGGVQNVLNRTAFYRTTTASSNALIEGYSDNTATETRHLLIFTDGDIQNTNNSYGALSDERLKENITPASDQLDDIMAVEIVNYDYKAGGIRQLGVIAQQLESAGMSGLVKEDEDGMKSVKYSILYMKAIKALQEAVTRIETLEDEVAALKGA